MCLLYKEVINPELFKEADKCRGQALQRADAACSCYYKAFDSCLNGYTCSVGSQRNCQCSCEVNRSQFCNAYKNCGNYVMLNEVFCPASPTYSSENVTLTAPCFKDEQEAVAQKIMDKLQYLAEVMDARKGMLLPSNCISDLEQQAAQLNAADPEISKGCKAPYVLIEMDTKVSEYTSASQGCLNCGPFNVDQKATQYTVGPDPEWKLPDPPPPECGTTSTTSSPPPGNDCDGAGG